jgi:hypothetical protein
VNETIRGHRTLVRLGEVGARQRGARSDRRRLESHLSWQRIDVNAVVRGDAPAIGAVAPSPRGRSGSS